MRVGGENSELIYVVVALWGACYVMLTTVYWFILHLYLGEGVVACILRVILPWAISPGFCTGR